MISKSDAQFINRCLGEIPSQGNITNHQFFESDVSEFLDNIGFEKEDLSHPWVHYFTSKPGNYCSKCRTDQNHCRCESPISEDTVYFLDANKLVSEWSDTVSSQNWFISQELTKISESSWKLECESESIGEVVFRIFTDGKLMYDVSPDPATRSLIIGFANHEYLRETDFSYWWAELLYSEFWGNVHRDLLNIQEPLSLPLCRYNAAAAQTNAEAIEDGFSAFFEKNGLSVVEEAQTVCPGVNQYVPVGEVNLVASKENQHILLCNCDVRPDHWHLHLYTDSNLVDVTKSDLAVRARDLMRDKIKRYNELADARTDIPAAAKILAPVMGLGLIAPLLQLVELFDLGLTTQQGLFILVSIVIIQLLLGASVLYFALKPLYDIRSMSWNIG